MAPYRPKSLDELNQAYDKAKEQQPVSRPAPTAPQPQQPVPQPAAPTAQPTPGRSIADAVRAQESKQALSGAVDDFIKAFSSKETAPQSAYAQAQQTAQETSAQASREIAQETKQAFDDVLSFPEIKTTPLEPPVYHRYTPHEEAPIKEGDLSGLMDEYIAVMTDQNGEEEENRRSFLRRRKDRKKSKQPQITDSEAAADLFDVPEPEPVAPVVPPVAPVKIPFEEPAAPVEIPVEEPIAPVEIPFEEPVVPVEIPFEEPVAPVEIPFEEPVAPVEIPVEEPAAPVEIPFEEPVAPVEIPFEEPVTPVEIPFEEPAAPVEIPFEEPVAPVEIPFEEPIAPVEIPFEEPVAPVEIPVEEPAVPEEIPVEEPALPEEAPAEEPIVPKMPEYTPYRSPLEDQPVRTQQKPKQPVNMEPEPIFDPRRLFSDLDDDELPIEEPAAPAIAEPEPPVMAAEVPAAAEPVIPIAIPVPPQEHQFEDVVSYSDETQDDRFTPQAEEPAAPEETPAPEEPLPAPEEAPAQAEAQEDDEIDFDETDLQQEVVIRPSKVKIFFKVIVTLLILVSLLATVAVGVTKLLNINTGKSAVGDYYFFAVSNDYANVEIHSGDLVLAKRKLPLDVGDRVVYVDPESHSFSFGKTEASSADPERYNALLYNISGVVVREENVLGMVQTTIPQGGTLVRTVLSDYNTYLLACLGAFAFLLLIRVLFLRKKRRYLTIEELAQSSEAAALKEKGKKKKKKPAKAKKAKAEKKAKQPSAEQPAAPADEDDLFGDID